MEQAYAGQISFVITEPDFSSDEFAATMRRHGISLMTRFTANGRAMVAVGTVNTRGHLIPDAVSAVRAVISASGIRHGLVSLGLHTSPNSAHPYRYVIDSENGEFREVGYYEATSLIAARTA